MSERASPPPVRRRYLVLFLLLILPLVTRDRAWIETDPMAGIGGLRKIMRTLNEIKARAANYPGDAKLYEAAIAAMLNTVGDRYTNYMPPEALRNVENYMTDTPIGGIGGYFTPIPGRGLRLDGLVPAAAAAAAGMRPGDIITVVDGFSLDGISEERMAGLLMGTPGSAVNLTYERDGESSDVSLKRWAFPKRTVSGEEMLDGRPRLGYVHLQVFSHDAASDLDAAIGRLRRRGARGLILDLRGNGGGEMEAGLAVADLFLADGIVTRVERGDGGGHWMRPLDILGGGVYRARPGGPHEDLPLALLVDGVTASASELVAAALRDNGRAFLVGTKTFGKARIQELRSLGSGVGDGGMRITVARFLTPKDVDFEGAGLEPDIALSLTEDEERVLRGNLTSKWFGLDPLIPDDPVIGKAAKRLREILSRGGD